MSSNKAKASAIGDMDCTCCGKIAVVRRKSSGTLYVWCAECGLFSMTMPRGQDYILKHARIWKDGVPPEDLPPWIRENRAWLYPPKRSARDAQTVLAAINGDAEVQGGGAIASPAPLQPPVLPPQSPKSAPAVKTDPEPPKKKSGLFDGGLF